MRFVPIAGPSRRIRRRREDRPYTPYDNPYLHVWLDASDESTLTTRIEDGVEYLAEWRDKSGNGHHFFQDTASQQPLVIRVNGQVDAIEFRRTPTLLFLRSASEVALSRLSLVGVWQAGNHLDNSCVLNRGTSRWVFLNENEGGSIRTGGEYNTHRFSGMQFGRYYLQSILLGDGESRMWLNGAESQNGPVANTGSWAWSSISRRSATTGYDGRVREVILRSIDDERWLKADEQYIMDKWGEV